MIDAHRSAHFGRRHPYSQYCQPASAALPCCEFLHVHDKESHMALLRNIGPQTTIALFHASLFALVKKTC